MKSYGFFIIIFILIGISDISAEKPQALSSIKIQNCDKIIKFPQIDNVKIIKGDSIKYKESSFDDSEWDTVTIPSNWSKRYPGWSGICWYRIRIEFTDCIPSKSFALKLGYILNADETYFNGVLIGKTGEISDPSSLVYDKTRIYEIPSSLIKSGGINIIAVRVKGLFPEVNGIYSGSISAGPFETIQMKYLSGEFINMLFVVIYLAAGIYFFISFFRITGGREYLFFSLLSNTSAVYIALRTEVKYLFFSDGLILKKIEYLSLILVFVFLFMFVTKYFHKKIRALHIVFISVSAVSFFAILFTGDIVVWKWFLYYVIHPSWTLPIGYFIYFSVKYYRTLIENKYLFVGLMIALAAAINDILLTWNVYNFIFLSGYSFMFIIIGISVVMYKRFARMYSDASRVEPARSSRPIEINENLLNRLNSAIELLKENYNTDISREEIADRLEINPDTLGKIFKKHTGKTISDYKNELRIHEAIRLLKTTDHNIIDIAFTVGFENLSTFYRLFQKTVGYPPNRMREDGNK